MKYGKTHSMRAQWFNGGSSENFDYREENESALIETNGETTIEEQIADLTDLVTILAEVLTYD